MKRPKVNCSAIFKTNPTDRGMCCTFNALAAEEIYRWSLASPAFYIDWNVLQKVTVLWVCCKSPKRKCPRLLWGSAWTAWGVRNTLISSQIGFWPAKRFLGLSYSNWIVLSPTGGASQGMSPGLKLVSLSSRVLFKAFVIKVYGTFVTNNISLWNCDFSKISIQLD